MNDSWQIGDRLTITGFWRVDDGTEATITDIEDPTMTAYTTFCVELDDGYRFYVERDWFEKYAEKIDVR